MKEEIQAYFTKLLIDIAQTDTQIVLFVILLVIIVMVLDAVSTFARRRRRETGIEQRKAIVQVQGTDSSPVRDYVSDMQGLAGRPDALIREDGFLIPVERKPLARKLRDRYVAQLLVYMRLVEEFEGKKPPYGYLILGPNCRRIRIENSEKRQRWLQNIIDAMQGILKGTETARAQPHPVKCAKCALQEACKFRI